MVWFFTSLLLVTIVNLLAYWWAFKNQSDKLTDITYSLCFIILATILLIGWGTLNFPRIILTLMVLVWGMRLGGFLLYRIRSMGKDDRFDDFRESKSGFLKFWLLQSVSIWILSWPIIIGLTTTETLEVSIPALALFVLGWTLETVADFQKYIFKNTFGKQVNIESGLYRYIRHPNYLGEILVWISIFWFVSPVLKGWEWVSVFSPIWLIILLIFISGIPLIEKTNLIKYQTNSKYTNYFKRTWRLIPFIY